MSADKKIALITGGNKGIGLETARQLGKLGITVLIGVRDEAKGEAAVVELKKDGVEARAVKLDVDNASDYAAVAKLIDIWGTPANAHIPESRYGAPQRMPTSQNRDMGHPSECPHLRIEIWGTQRMPTSQNRDMGHPANAHISKSRYGAPQRMPTSQNRDMGHPSECPHLRIEIWGTPANAHISESRYGAPQRMPTSQNRDMGHPSECPHLRIEIWGTQIQG